MLYKKIIRLFLGLLLVLAIGTPAFAKSKVVPEWVLNSKVVYPSSQYLSYIGSGSDKKTAEIEALNGLSAIFGQNIKSSTNASKRMEEASVNGSVAYKNVKSLDQDILREVDVSNLVGVEIKDIWFDDDCTWYAIAVMNREETLGIYKDMMEKNKETIDSLLLMANKDLYSLQSYCAYDFAQEVAVENKHNFEKVFVLDSKIAPLYEKYVVSPDFLGAKKLELSKNIPISIHIDGENTDVYANVFLEALADFGFSGNLEGDVRYIIEGEVSFDEEESSNGRTVKVYYDFEGYMLDTYTDNQLFPLNISGRQSHKTARQAKQRAEKELEKEMKNSFNNEFNKYLSNFIEK